MLLGELNVDKNTKSKNNRKLITIVVTYVTKTVNSIK